jgi:hypothetical protein
MLKNQSRNNCEKGKERTRKEKDRQEKEEEEEEEEMLAVRGSIYERWKRQGRWVGWAGLTWFCSVLHKRGGR